MKSKCCPISIVRLLGYLLVMLWVANIFQRWFRIFGAHIHQTNLDLGCYKWCQTWQPFHVEWVGLMHGGDFGILKELKWGVCNIPQSWLGIIKLLNIESVLLITFRITIHLFDALTHEQWDNPFCNLFSCNIHICKFTPYSLLGRWQ